MTHIGEMLRAWGPAGVFLLAILDSAGVPMIGGVDVLLVWVAVNNASTAYPSALYAIVASAIGSMFLFYLARKGGEAYLSRYTDTPRGAKLKQWFLEYGLLTVFIPAFLPIPMPLKIFEISAGALGVSPWAFLLVLIAARIPRYLGLAWLGLHLGTGTIPYLKHHVWELLLVAAGLFALSYFLIRHFDRRRRLAQVARGAA
jgi:membrane protein YqaA with SNARE-associated domain